MRQGTARWQEGGRQVHTKRLSIDDADHGQNSSRQRLPLPGQAGGDEVRCLVLESTSSFAKESKFMRSP